MTGQIHSSSRVWYLPVSRQFQGERGKKSWKHFSCSETTVKKKPNCQICMLAPQPQRPSSVERAPNGYCHGRSEPCALVRPWCQSTVGGERQPCAACSQTEKCNTRPEWLSIARRVQCSRAASPWKVVGTKGEPLRPGRAACIIPPPSPSLLCAPSGPLDTSWKVMP